MERSDGLVQRRRQPKQEEEDVDRNEQVCTFIVGSMLISYGSLFKTHSSILNSHSRI